MRLFNHKEQALNDQLAKMVTNPDQAHQKKVDIKDEEEKIDIEEELRLLQNSFQFSEEKQRQSWKLDIGNIFDNEQS